MAAPAGARSRANPVAAALRDTVVRYRLPPQALAELIDARAFDLYDEPMASLAELERYAAQTSATLIALAARILSDGERSGISELARHAGIAYAIAGLLRALPIHAARGQLYLPADVMQRYGAAPADVFAAKATTEIARGAGRTAAAARGSIWRRRAICLPATPAAVAPALLPVALVRPALERMERRGYEPFSPTDVPQWRRQWALWRAARTGLRTRVLSYSAAICAAVEPLLEVGERAGRQRALLRLSLGGAAQPAAVRDAWSGSCASGGNSPKLTFIGW